MYLKVFILENIMHEMASTLVAIQTQLRFFHWQTKSYARHQAYGGTYDAMDGLIDNFVEVLMGKYGRVPAVPASLAAGPRQWCARRIARPVGRAWGGP